MLRLRLKRTGRKRLASYRIVVMEQATRRDGRPIDELGFYNPITKQLTEPDIVKILNKIACEENTPTAHVDYDFIENLSDICIQYWCKKNKALPDDIQRICTLYLKPENEDNDFKLLLNSINT